MDVETVEPPISSTLENYEVQNSLDRVENRPKSKRFLDYFKEEKRIIEDINKFLNTKDSDDNLMTPPAAQIEYIQALVILRKQKWNLKQDARRILLQQLETFQYLFTQKKILEQRQKEMEEHVKKVIEYRQASQYLRTLDPHQMTTEERQQDRLHTQAESDYSNMFYRYKEDVKEYQKVEQQFRDKIYLLSDHKSMYETIHTNIQHKRQRLNATSAFFP